MKTALAEVGTGRDVTWTGTSKEEGEGQVGRDGGKEGGREGEGGHLDRHKPGRGGRAGRKGRGGREGGRECWVGRDMDRHKQGGRRRAGREGGREGRKGGRAPVDLEIYG